MNIRARVVLAIAFAIALFAGLLFGFAGRTDVPRFWVYLAQIGIYITSSSWLALRYNPDLVRERMKPPSDRDRATRRLALPFAFGHLVLAGLDVRFGWSDVPLALGVFGFLALAGGMTLVAWTMVANRFASSAVRIQADRGQTVVSGGPYAIVRHPMYFGVFAFTLGSGLALGSWWSALALLPMVPIFIRRTRIEDAMLHEELDGYADYAKRTRYRIIPGVF